MNLLFLSASIALRLRFDCTDWILILFWIYALLLFFNPWSTWVLVLPLEILYLPCLLLLFILWFIPMISILLRIFPCNDCRIFMVQSFCYMLIIQPYYFNSTSYCFYTIFFICFSAYRNHVFLFADSIFSRFLIFFFISLCSFSIFFTKTDSSQMIYESIKVLEIKISIVFNLVFAINTILSCFFIFFLNNWLILSNCCS